MTARRWVCPKCADGCLAPSRPRKDDVRRYCLQCSKKTGRLVERVCPAADNAKAREDAAVKVRRDVDRAATQARRAVEREQRTHARQAAQAERAALKKMPIGELAKLTGRASLEEAARRYSRLKAWEKDSMSERPFEIRLGAHNIASSGMAWGGNGRGRFVVTAGSDIADAHTTILHELAHLAAPHAANHDLQWRLFFRAAVSEVIGRPANLGTAREGRSDLTKEEFHNALKRELALFLYGQGGV